MIRPFTGLCILMAAGSGLYLYQVKHRADVLDRQIQRTVDATRQAQERVAALSAEYTRLQQPDRLQDLASRFLTLRPTQPTQYVQLASLASHLPEQQAPEPEAAPAQQDDETPDAAAPPAPAPVAAAQPAPAPAQTAPTKVAIRAAPPAPRPAPPRAVARVSPAFVEHVVPAAEHVTGRRTPGPAPMPIGAPIYQTVGEPLQRPSPMQFQGSALGEAAHVAMAPPVPIGR